MFAIVDCNNFYASCERLFRPDLRQSPIIVLSNNDGCVIARSNEAKALGIHMGQAYFQIRQMCKQFNIQVFSSNYALYGDLSARVMRIIQEAWPATEIYSIDEAFLNLSGLAAEQQEAFCQQLYHDILQQVGIPTSIGIAASKTLAKAANYLGKKSLKYTVLKIDAKSSLLNSVPISEVWGVGRQWSKKLISQHIHTAKDLQRQSPAIIRSQFGLPLMQTCLELQGIPCHELSQQIAKKSITASRSFGKTQTDKAILAQALSAHCARATEKLWQQNGFIEHLSVYIRTNPFQEQRPQYSNCARIQLPQISNDLRLITHYAKKALDRIYQPGYAYHKIGVCFEHVFTQQQQSFFNEDLPKNNPSLIQVWQDIQNKYGQQSIFLAAQGVTRPWSMRTEHRSPRYTTCWHELASVKLT